MMTVPRGKRTITLSCTVDPYRSGWSVTEFLCHRFPYHSRERWIERIVGRRVRLNGLAATPETVVRSGDTVEYTIEHEEPEVDFRYTVVHRDDHLLAVSKSGNIPVHACGVYITNTLIARLRRDFKEEVSLAHRLDRETSGLVLLSMHKDAARSLSRQFREGKVKKIYLALVEGRIEEESFAVDAPIAEAPSARKSPVPPGRNPHALFLPKRVVDFAAGKPARTLFVRVGWIGGRTLLKAFPMSGRTNQIRVHLSFAGHPVIGDKSYGLSEELREEALRSGMTPRVRRALVKERQMLHCWKMELEDPLTGEPLLLEAPIPRDMSFVSPLLRAADGAQQP